MLTLSLLASSSMAITGGGPTAPGDQSETVLVRAGLDTCTGTLIAPNWVITAALCFDAVDTSEPLQVQVLEGRGSEAGFTTSHHAAQLVVHPRYVAAGASWIAWATAGETAPDGQVYNETANDLALVRLATPATGTPVPINGTPLGEDDLGGLHASVVGFGLTAADASDSGTQRDTTVSLISFEPAPPLGSGFINAGLATCHGDMGAPALVAVDGDPVLVGVASREPGCVAGQTSPFVPVAPHLDWIQDHVDQVGIRSVDPPRIACSHALPDGSGALGAAPVELRCTVSHPDLDGSEAVAWDWGDGSQVETRTAELEQASHVFEAQGVYTVSACFERDGSQSCVANPLPLTVCETPDVAFEVEDLGSNTLRTQNLTPSDIADCIGDVRWEVYEGSDVAGEPVQVFTSWNPEIVLDDAGTYTLVLNVGGIAGTAAASAVVEVGGSAGCDVSGAGLLGLFAVPLLFARRRRRHLDASPRSNRW